MICLMIYTRVCTTMKECFEQCTFAGAQTEGAQRISAAVQQESL